jgi:chromosome segregation protein
VFLNRLSIRGFKSFPAKTTLDFGDGLTGVVGPNGCGKSNIVDALRWVMGEQRTRQLRGTRMEQVIFNGSRDSGPAGMAEVSVSFDNSTRRLHTEYDDVVVTRRLYRTGESDYELNGTSCRLLDVLDLFFDTGIGSHSYSILTREMVDAIIADRAEDRRFLFEEAAGISRYKHRKRAAIRKLEGVERDITRLADILREVERQVRSLSNQAARARRSRRYAEELRDLEITFAVREHASLTRRTDDVRRESDGVRDRVAALAADAGRHEAELAGLRERAAAAERTVAEAQRTAHEADRAVTSAQSSVAVDRERASALRAQSKRDADEVETLKQRRTALVERIEQISTERAQFIEKAKQAQIVKKRREEELGRYVEGKTAMREAADEADGGLSEVEKRLAAVGAEIAAADVERAGLSERLADEKAELERFGAEAEDRTQQRRTAEQRLQRARESLIGLRTERDETEKKREATRISLESEQERASKLAATVEADRARLSAARAIIERHEGFSHGVRAVLESPSDLPGVLGVVGELLRVRREYRHAVEATLGESAAFVVVADRDAARGAVRFLRTGRRGRATFLPLSDLPRVARPPLPDGAIGWLDEGVSVDSGLSKLAGFLLGSVAVVRSADDSTAALAAGVTYATLDGEVFQPDGTVSGGVRAEGEVALVGRDLDVDRLEGELSRAETDLKSSRGAIENARRDISGHDRALSKLSNDLSSAVEETGAAERTVARLDFESESAARSVERVERQIADLESRVATLDGRSQTLREKRQEIGTILETAGDKAKRAKEELDRHDVERAEAASLLSEVQLELVALGGRIESLDAEDARSAELLSDVEQSIDQREARRADAESQLAQMQTRLDSIGDELKELFSELDARNADAVARQDELNAVREDQRRVEERLDDLRNKRAEEESQLHELDVVAVEVKTRTDDLAERVFGEHEADIAQMRPEELPDEEWEKREGRIDFLRRVRQRIGVVNPLADVEHEEQKQRAEFLNAQIADLQAARSDLHEVINELNRTAREKFMAVFGDVRDNFVSLFSRLFEGGEADLLLEEGVDVLESDINIVARPKGKRLQSIAQLSTGERALTSLALLFAMYLVRPSPFTVLDEVDAPLDDANVERFLSLIRDFSDESQFLVITHNKRTMAACDVLFGITMEEPGVSKVVSVHFEDLPSEPSLVSSGSEQGGE